MGYVILDNQKCSRRLHFCPEFGDLASLNNVSVSKESQGK